MANPTIFEYEIEDDQGLSNRNSLYIAYNGAVMTVDAMIGGWLAFGGLLDPCIDGRIVQGRITIPLNADASWKQAAIEGNNVNQVMALNFENASNRYLTPVLLPSYKETLLTPAGAPDFVDPVLAPYIAAVIAGTINVFPNSRDLEDLNALRDGFLTVRKVRNQKQRTRVTA